MRTSSLCSPTISRAAICRHPAKRGHCFAREAHIPAIRLSADRNRLGPARDRGGPTHGEPANRGQHEKTVLQRGTGAELLVGEAVVKGLAIEPLAQAEGLSGHFL